MGMPGGMLLPLEVDLIILSFLVDLIILTYFRSARARVYVYIIDTWSRGVVAAFVPVPCATLPSLDDHFAVCAALPARLGGARVCLLSVRRTVSLCAVWRCVSVCCVHCVSVCCVAL